MSDGYRHQTDPTAYPGPPQPHGGNGLATAGFVLGLVGLFGSWIPFLNVMAILVAVIGVILAGFGLAQSKTVGGGRRLAIAGMVLGVLAVVLAVLVNVLLLRVVDTTVNESASVSTTS